MSVPFDVRLLAGIQAEQSTRFGRPTSTARYQRAEGCTTYSSHTRVFAIDEKMPERRFAPCRGQPPHVTTRILELVGLEVTSYDLVKRQTCFATG